MCKEQLPQFAQGKGIACFSFMYKCAMRRGSESATSMPQRPLKMQNVCVCMAPENAI